MSQQKLINVFAQFYPETSKYGKLLKTAVDFGVVAKHIVTPPANLLQAMGAGLRGAGNAAHAVTSSMPDHGQLARMLASLPSAVAGGAKSFYDAGGVGAGALTGLGASALYGGKKLYDEYASPAGYYKPGGY
jgi:hypothetical protein